MNESYRNIPSVNDLVESESLAGLSDRVPRSLIVDAARRVLDEHRAALSKTSTKIDTPTLTDFAQRIEKEVELNQKPPLASVINATGIIIHTGLGRAPLAEEAVLALADVGKYYAPVELDMQSGERGKRTTIVRDLLCELTGAESATVVNNNAAALMIVLSTFANGKSVVVSRGELIEIGGSFRLPDVMEAGGAKLKEVGTTNKTRLSDYEEAIDDSTSALMKVHSSNYRIEGFTDAPKVNELAELAHNRGLIFIHDTGSGALRDLSRLGIKDEPDARSSIEAGADLVLFSGDKLLGGPQAGILVGKRELIEKIEKNPMMRAMRLDKLILGALGVTLQLHRDEDQAASRIPVLRMLTTDIDELEKRANAIVNKLTELNGIGSSEVLPSRSYLGGGALPAQAIPSVAIAIKPANCSEEELSNRLRKGDIPIISRVHGGCVILDMRTIFSEQDEKLVKAVESAIQ